MIPELEEMVELEVTYNARLQGMIVKNVTSGSRGILLDTYCESLDHDVNVELQEVIQEVCKTGHRGDNPATVGGFVECNVPRALWMIIWGCAEMLNTDGEIVYD